MDFACLYDRRTLYPVSHVFTPFLIYMLTHNAFLTVMLFAAWELFEYITYELFNGYGIYPGDIEEMCDVIVLDLGNGFLGLFLALFVAWWHDFDPANLACGKPRTGCCGAVWEAIKAWSPTIVFGALWSLFSSLDFECKHWLFRCDYTAWGIPLMTLLLGIYAYYLHRLGKTRVAKVLFGVGALYLNITWIPLSTPLLMYYASIAVFLLAWRHTTSPINTDDKRPKDGIRRVPSLYRGVDLRGVHLGVQFPRTQRPHLEQTGVQREF